MQLTKALVTSLAIAFSGVALAHNDDGVQKFIDYRSSVMTVFKWNMGPMGAMMKGEMPYDQQTFEHHAKDLASAARLDLLAGFPEGSEEGDTDARVDIWMNWDDFLTKYETLQRESGKLAEVSAAGDQEAIKTQFGAVGKACKSCHDDYKD
jgi:cytochrome c556